MVESLFIIIARRRETEQPRERKRAPSSFLAYSRYENRKTDELRNDVLFFVFRDRSDDAFGTISDQQYEYLSSSSLDAEKPNNRESANAHLLLFSLIRDTKTERPMSSEKTWCFLSSAIVPTTPSERSQNRKNVFHHHRSTPRNRTTARARTHLLLFFLYLLVHRKNQDR